jgi:hypothetical protein
MTTADRMARLRAEEKLALARARVALGLAEPLEVADLLGRAGSAVDDDTSASRLRTARMHAASRPRSRARC